MPSGPFYYNPDHDTNDGNNWSAMDIEDLTNHLRSGGTVESAAQLLCREGTVEDVRRKARELRLIE